MAITRHEKEPSANSMEGRTGRLQRSVFARYGFMLLCLTVALAVRWSLTRWIIDYDPFMFFAPAALLSAWFGGLGPGIVGWVGGIVLGDFFFTGPPYQFGPYGAVQITLMATYSVETAIGIVLIEALQKVRHRAQASAEQAHSRGERLERAMAERKVAEDALRVREEQLRLMTDSLPVLIAHIDREQRYQFLNRQYESWFGCARSEAYGRHISELWGEEAYDIMRRHIDAAFSGQQITYERWVENAKGKRYNQITYVPDVGEGGVIKGLFVLVTDMTEQRQTEEELRRAQTQLSKHAAELEERVAERTAKLLQALEDMEKLLYSMAHDLRAPLRAMAGFTTLLLKQYSAHLDAAGQDYARRISAAATRMDRLILDLLAYGRLSHLPLACVRVDLQAQIRGVLARMCDEISKSNAQINVQQPLIPVCANPQLLEDILLNLLSNALKFVAPGVCPQVMISSETLEGKVRLWIQDNGVGIAPEHHQRIFKLFERLHGPEAYPGTGVGLAIVAKAAERMEGKAGVESNQGLGSRFWLELPPAPSSS